MRSEAGTSASESDREIEAMNRKSILIAVGSLEAKWHWSDLNCGKRREGEERTHCQGKADEQKEEERSRLSSKISHEVDDQVEDDSVGNLVRQVNHHGCERLLRIQSRSRVSVDEETDGRGERTALGR